MRKKQTRVVCFYLPQFHPIPENNTWWGDGFTEWTNVKPAQPQFHGHYQPHVPIDLGYYDLLNKDTQARQITLAKEYGVYGFCFYFYWFAGKTLLEAPVLNYFKDPALDLPFCLCWANENWSRRWDGLDHEILIAQSYSASDDINFISHIRQYLESGKYIRYEGKPLVVVYRPNLLPDAKATVLRWRNWCRDHGIGEIHLAYVQSFEKVNPEIYGFDSAIEFPPSQFPQRKIQSKDIEGINPQFSGHIVDYHSICRRDRDYRDVGYRLFRGVTPSWDNTARRGQKGIILKNSSPGAYMKWLKSAILASLRDPRQSEPMVFINAWNEWAEGAHLEPDDRYGYEFLEETREALLSAESIHKSKDNSKKNYRLIIHNISRNLIRDLQKHVSSIGEWLSK
jgi:lipopolysaccharide biosynthesis protein